MLPSPDHVWTAGELVAVVMALWWRMDRTERRTRTWYKRIVRRFKAHEERDNKRFAAVRRQIDSLSERQHRQSHLRERAA